jgi:hypothetical protein
MDNASLAAREFRLDPMYVRCGLYFTPSWILLGFVVIWVNGIRLNPPPGSEFLPFGFWITSVLGLLPLHWRLRVDTRGISRRRFLRWDLWPWDDFAAERLKFGYGDRCFVDPARPFWRRELSLAMLTKCDSDVVWKWIALVWQPAETCVPEVLELRVGNFFKRAVRCDRSGIELGRGTRAQRFTWNEVVSLEVDKLRHERADFRRLTLELPGTKLVFFRTLHNGVEGRSWSGAEPDVIPRYLLAQVPEERQLVLANLDDPITQRELEVRLTHARKESHDIRRRVSCLAALLIVAAVGSAVMREWLMVVMIVGYAVTYGSIIWFGYRQRRTSLQKLNSMCFSDPVENAATS